MTYLVLFDVIFGSLIGFFTARVASKCFFPEGKNYLVVLIFGWVASIISFSFFSGISFMGIASLFSFAGIPATVASVALVAVISMLIGLVSTAILVFLERPSSIPPSDPG